uniref:Chromosome 9 open reading frame 116 n=1 Tax=Amazona collaria TaxID=241587 RepID=A0A8B9FSF0_9PSIT
MPTSLFVPQVHACIKEIFQAEELLHVEEVGVSPGAGPRTSDCYRTSAALPGRFQQPDRFCGYGKPEPHPRYRTTNQTYGSRAPTVHEVPTSFHITPHAFTRIQGMGGPYRNCGLNTALEKSHVTGPGNFITASECLDFHPSYNPKGPSHC